MAHIDVFTEKKYRVQTGKLLEMMVHQNYEGSVTENERGFCVDIEDDDDRVFETVRSIFLALNRLIDRTEVVCTYREWQSAVSYYDSVNVEAHFDPDCMQVHLCFDAELEVTDSTRNDVETEVHEQVLEMLEDEGIEIDEDSENFDPDVFEEHYGELFEEVMSESFCDIVEDMMDEYDPYINHSESVLEQAGDEAFIATIYRMALSRGEDEIAARILAKVPAVTDYEE